MTKLVEVDKMNDKKALGFKSYKFWFLHFYTFDQKYKIGIIKNVKEVEEFIESKHSIDTDIF